MLSIFEKRFLCMLLAALLLLLSVGWAEEAAAPEPYIAEIPETDLLSPEIYVDSLETEALPREEATLECQPSEVEAAPIEGEAIAQSSALYAPTTFQSSLILGVKEQATLNGAAFSGELPVSYVSSKPKVARVDENGTVVARRTGEAIITCYQGGMPRGECRVSVLNAPKKVSFPDKSIVLSKGQTRAYAATLPKGSAGRIVYISDKPDVLSVDAEGNLHGLSGGTATLTARAYNGKTARCTVRVLGSPAPSWVALNENALLMPVKGTAQLVARFDEGREALLTYTTSDQKVAKVSEAGLVTARKAGSAAITVTTHNGLTATCEVQVYDLPKKVTLNASKLSMYVDDGYQLTATLTKNSRSEISWTSDDPAVAAVDGNGFVMAKGVGKAVITARTVNGKRAKCSITVKAHETPVPVVDGIRGTVVYHEESDTLKVTIANDKGVYLTYIWVEDPSRQLFKHYGNSRPERILQDAVKQHGLQEKTVIGFNASPPVNSSHYPKWNQDANYRHREPSPLMIANGEVLVNDPTKSNKEKYLYWMDGNGQLRHSDRTIDAMTVAERADLYREVIASGARNTMIWQPVLITDYQPTYMDAAFLKRKAGDQRKQALCQMDDHNFILVSSSGSGKMTYPEFQRYLLGLGCKTAIEFDAGGSTSLLWKPKNAQTVQVVTGGGRSLTMVMYFSE